LLKSISAGGRCPRMTLEGCRFGSSPFVTIVESAADMRNLAAREHLGGIPGDGLQKPFTSGG
jgi:hypothetical protein